MRKEETTSSGWGVLQSLISPSKGSETKKKKKKEEEEEEASTARDIRFWSPIEVRTPRTRAQPFLSGRHAVLSLWYSDSERISEKVTNREKITDIGWENKNCHCLETIHFPVESHSTTRTAPRLVHVKSCSAGLAAG